MNKQSIIENDTIGRYVRNQLSPEEEADFEAAYFSDPELVQMVEAEQHLRNIANQKFAVVRSHPKAPISYLPLAASLFVGVLVGGGVAQFTERDRPTTDQPEIALARSLQITRSDTVRKQGINIHEVQADTLDLMLTLPSELPSFVVVLSDSTGKAIWQDRVEGVNPNSTRLIIRIPTSLLVAGAHSITVEDHDSNISYQYGFVISE